MYDPIAQDLAEQILESIDADSVDQADIAALVGETLGDICKDIFSILELRNVELYAGDAFSSTIGEGIIMDDDEPTEESISAEMADDDFDDMFFELDSEE